MAFQFDEDGLKVDQPCADPSQRGWADYLDNLVQDLRDGKISIRSVRHDLNAKSIEVRYDGITTK